MIHDGTPIWQLTVAEFKTLINETKETKQVQPIDNGNENVYGIAGLAELLNCSKTTAQKIKSSGDIDKAITQVGRQIIINKKQVIEILKSKSHV